MKGAAVSAGGAGIMKQKATRVTDTATDDVLVGRVDGATAFN